MRESRRVLLAIVSLSLFLLLGASASNDEIDRFGKLMECGEIGFAAVKVAGEGGLVYLTELGEKKHKELEEEVATRGLKNVVVLQPEEMDASLLRSLKPGGELAVIDFPPRKWLSESDPVEGVPANRGGHGNPEKVLVEELKAARFVAEKVVEDWPEESYCVVARKEEVKK